LDPFFLLSLLFEFDGLGDGFCSALLTVGEGEGRTSGVGDGLTSAATLASGTGIVGRMANKLIPIMTIRRIAEATKVARKDFLFAVRGTSTLANLLSED